MAYTNHAFCWHGVVSTDTESTRAFLCEVLGWRAQQMQMGDETSTMFVAADVPRAHLREPGMPGEPSHIVNYLRVDDVDASTAAAEANGGRVLVPGTDIAPGRFSVVTSPSGAAVALFKEADDSAQNAPSGPGSFAWVELHSKDIDADNAWLTATFGFEIEEMPMPNGPYFILKHDGEMRGGTMTQEHAEAPAMWLAWIDVDDVDATVERARSHGGAVHAEPFDVPGVGRLSIIADPVGVVLGVMKGA